MFGAARSVLVEDCRAAPGIGSGVGGWLRSMSWLGRRDLDWRLSGMPEAESCVPIASYGLSMELGKIFLKAETRGSSSAVHSGCQQIEQLGPFRYIRPLLRSLVLSFVYNP